MIEKRLDSFEITAYKVKEIAEKVLYVFEYIVYILSFRLVGKHRLHVEIQRTSV